MYRDWREVIMTLASEGEMKKRETKIYANWLEEITKDRAFLLKGRELLPLGRCF